MPARPAGIVAPRRPARVHPFPSADGCAAAGPRTRPSLALLSEILSPLSFPPSLPHASLAARRSLCCAARAPLAHWRRHERHTPAPAPAARARARQPPRGLARKKKKRTIFHVKLSRPHFALDTISKRTPDFHDFLNSEKFAVTWWCIFWSRKAANCFFVGAAAARGSRSAHTWWGGSGLLAPACHTSRPRAACKGRGRGRVACVAEVRGRRAQAPRAWRSGALRAPRRAACTPAAAAAGPPTRARPGSGEEGSRARRRAPGGACRNITGVAIVRCGQW